MSMPYVNIAQITDANTNLDGSGTLTPIAKPTPGMELMLESITVKAPVTTTAGNCRIFLRKDNVTRVIAEFDVDAISVAAGTNSFTGTLVFVDREYPSGHSLAADILLPSFPMYGSMELLATMHNNEDMNVLVVGRETPLSK